MANVFDIFNKKSAISVEVTENEQMNRNSPRTPGSGDSLLQQGVNNDSPFENKDGAKASGNYAYGVESRNEMQDTPSPFTIPKLKRSKQDLFVDISTESREWQQETLPILSKYFRFPSSSARFEFLRVSMVQNTERTQKYADKRKEMRQNGYSERDVADSFAFLSVDDDKQVERIGREGLSIGNLISSTIGHPQMGAQLSRYIDTIRPANFVPGSTCKVFVFKVMKGKVKAVTENRTGPPLEPTPNFDCHMAKSSLDVSPASQQQLYELYQVYLYEYGEDQTVETFPRHVLPYAVISFRYKDAPPSPRILESPPIFSPRLSSPPVPKFTVSAPKEADDPEYVIWCGDLRVTGILDCQVKMVSTASQYKPAHLGTVLNVRDTCEMKIAGDRYFKELSCLRKGGEVYWKGWYISVAELRPRPDSKTQFLRLMNHLSRTDTMAVLKPENDVILLLAPNSSLTHDLGLTRPHHYPVMFHCIFLCKHSAKFKSPGYIQKALLRQTGGSSTPSWLDSGQMSPIAINVYSSSRPFSSAPGSPAILSPTFGLSSHSGSDRSPGYGSSPRDELAVWTDALSGGRSAESSSSVSQSAGEERDDVPSRAHDLIRLHRSLSTDLASHESPGKTIPLGNDEGFLSVMPPSARIKPQRLRNAFKIQHQIQESMALSSSEPLLCELPSSETPLPTSPSMSTRGDVEQDDTITSSTSLDPASQPVSRPRSTSTDAVFSPVPSPENISEPDEAGADTGIHSESSLLTVPKESHSREKSLYIPPPNIPEYKPTPLYEPLAKRYKMDEGSRHSGSIPSLERGSSSRSSSSSASGYRSASFSMPSVGLTHVRSPRDLPLPISPADSSTDKMKSLTPPSSNITTANDMKNFLNASLERKPSARSSLSLSRSQTALPVRPPNYGAHLSHLSDHCALSRHSGTGSAINRSKPHSGVATAIPAGVGRASSHVPSVIIRIPFSCLHRLPTVQSHRRRHPSQAVKRLESTQNLDCTMPEFQRNMNNPKACVVRIHPSSLFRPPNTSVSLKYSSATGKKNVDKHSSVTQTTFCASVDQNVSDDNRMSCECGELKQQQLSLGLPQPSVQNCVSHVAHRDHHMHISCPSNDTHCDLQPMLHDTTIQPLQQISVSKRRSKSPQQKHCTYSTTQFGTVPQNLICTREEIKQGIHSLNRIGQAPEAQENSQLHPAQSDQVLQNGEPPVPLDVLELINRLKTVAKERMIEEAVAKLMNLGTTRRESFVSPPEKVDSETGVKKFEDRHCLSDENAKHYVGTDVSSTRKSNTSSLHSHNDILMDDHHPDSLAHELKYCGIYCESFLKPGNQYQEQDQMTGECRRTVPGNPFQMETDKDTSAEESTSVNVNRNCASPESTSVTVNRNSASPESTSVTVNRNSASPESTKDLSEKILHKEADCLFSVDSLKKHVPPLVLKRQGGSVKGKFKIVKADSSSDCLVDETCGADKYSEKGTALLSYGRKLKQKKCVLKANRRRRNTCFNKKDSESLFSDLQSCDAESFSLRPMVSTSYIVPYQHSTDIEVFMMLGDNSDNGKETAGSSSSHTDGQNLDDIADRITTIIGNEFLDNVSEACDSDDIVEQIDKILSESNSPPLDTELYVTQQNKPGHEIERNAIQSRTRVNINETIENTVQNDDNVGAAVQEESVIIKTLDYKNVDRNKEKGSPHKSCDNVAEDFLVSVENCSESNLNDCNENSSVDSEISPELSNFKRCSVILTDLNTSELQLNVQETYRIIGGKIIPLNKNLKSPQISQSLENSESKNSCHPHSSLKNSAPVGDMSSKTASFAPMELQDVVSDCIQLEDNQLLECVSDSVVFVSAEMELEDEVRSSQHTCQKVDTESSESLKFSKQVDKTDLSNKKVVQSTSMQQTSALSKCEHADKVKSASAGKISKDLVKKQSKTVCKRRKNQLRKSQMLQNINKQGCSQNHSWYDVLQEMNILSASSCTNKTQSEPARTRLPRIPKRMKQPEKSVSINTVTKSPSFDKSSLEHVAQTVPYPQKQNKMTFEKSVSSDTGSPETVKSNAEEKGTTLQPSSERWSSNMKHQNEVRKKLNAGESLSIHDQGRHSFVGDQTNRNIAASRKAVSSLSFRTNGTKERQFVYGKEHYSEKQSVHGKGQCSVAGDKARMHVSASRDNTSSLSLTNFSMSQAQSLMHAPSKPILAAGHFKQLPPEMNWSQNSEHVECTYKVNDMQQHRLQNSQSADIFLPQKKSAKNNSGSSNFHSISGKRPLMSQAVQGFTSLNYTCGSGTVSQTVSTSSQQLRDPRKRALMKRGYAGIKHPISSVSVLDNSEGEMIDGCDNQHTNYMTTNARSSHFSENCSVKSGLNGTAQLLTGVKISDESSLRKPQGFTMNCAHSGQLDSSAERAGQQVLFRPEAWQNISVDWQDASHKGIQPKDNESDQLKATLVCKTNTAAETESFEQSLEETVCKKKSVQYHRSKPFITEVPVDQSFVKAKIEVTPQYRGTALQTIARRDTENASSGFEGKACSADHLLTLCHTHMMTQNVLPTETVKNLCESTNKLTEINTLQKLEVASDLMKPTACISSSAQNVVDVENVPDTGHDLLEMQAGQNLSDFFEHLVDASSSINQTELVKELTSSYLPQSPLRPFEDSNAIQESDVICQTLHEIQTKDVNVETCTLPTSCRAGQDSSVSEILQDLSQLIHRTMEVCAACDSSQAVQLGSNDSAKQMTVESQQMFEPNDKADQSVKSQQKLEPNGMADQSEESQQIFLEPDEIFLEPTDKAELCATKEMQLQGTQEKIENLNTEQHDVHEVLHDLSKALATHTFHAESRNQQDTRTPVQTTADVRDEVSKPIEDSEQPIDTPIIQGRYITETSRHMQVLTKDCISQSAPKDHAAKIEVITHEDVRKKCFVQNVVGDIVVNGEQNDLVFLHKAADSDLPVTVGEVLNLPKLTDVACEISESKPLVENAPRQDAATDRCETWTSKWPSLTVCKQQTGSPDILAGSCADTLTMSACSASCHFKESSGAGIKLPDNDTSSPQGIYPSDTATHTTVQMDVSLTTAHSQQKIVLSGSDEAPGHRSDEQHPLSGEFTVIDECGDPDSVAISFSDVFIRDLDLNEDCKRKKDGFKQPHEPWSRKKKKGPEICSASGSRAAQSGMKPHLPSGVLLQFANTVIRNYNENKNDLKQKKKCANGALLHDSDFPCALLEQTCSSGSSTMSESPGRKTRSSSRSQQTNSSGSSTKLGSPDRKTRSGSLSRYGQRRPRSPNYQKKEKSWSPIPSKGAERQRSRSPRDSRRGRSSSSQRRARSRSPTGSYAGSRGRNESGRDERQIYPVRVRDRERIIEERRHRQYHPYDSRDRDRRADLDRQRRCDRYSKPVASFHLAYRELDELLVNNTSQTFQKRLTKDSVSPASLFNDKCYRGHRFRGYRFSRSQVPSYSKWKASSSIEKAVAEKETSSIESSEEEEKEDVEDRTRKAQKLDEMLGEAEEPCQEEKMEWNTQEICGVRPSAPISTSAILTEECQGSLLVKNSDVDDNQSFPIQVISSTSSTTGDCASENNKYLPASSDLIVLQAGDGSQQERILSKQSTVQASSGNHDLVSSQKPLTFSLQNNQKMCDTSKVTIGINFEAGQHHASTHRPLKDMHEQGLARHHVAEQQQSLHDCQQKLYTESERERSITEIPHGRQKGNTTSHVNHVSRSLCKSLYPNQSALSEDYIQDLPGCCHHGDTRDISPPAHKGPCTPPGPCPDDSPVECSSEELALAQDRLEFQNRLEETGRFQSTAGRFTAGSHIGPKTPPDPDPTSQCPQISLESVCNRLQLETPFWKTRASGLPRIGRRRHLSESQAFSDISHVETRHGQSSLTESELKRSDSDNPQSLNSKPDGTTVLKIINIAKLNAAANQIRPCQPASCLEFPHTVSSSDTVHSIWSDFKLPVTSTTLEGEQVFHAEQPVTTISIPFQEQQTCLVSARHGAPQELQHSVGEQTVNEARQNMDRLVQQLQAYINVMEQGIRTDEQNTAIELTPPPSPPVSRRHRSHQLIVLLPWKLHPWPGTPVPITFVERNPDYQPDPLLMEQGNTVEVMTLGEDPRLDPDRPVFVPAGRSKQAKQKAKKRPILISIKVVKDIPLEPVHVEGKCLPKDPRHAFKSSVDELDHNVDDMECTDKEENDVGDGSSSDTDCGEGKIEGVRYSSPVEDVRFGSPEKDQIHSKKMQNPQECFKDVENQDHECAGKEFNLSCESEIIKGNEINIEAQNCSQPTQSEHLPYKRENIENEDISVEMQNCSQPSLFEADAWAGQSQQQEKLHVNGNVEESNMVSVDDGHSNQVSTEDPVEMVVDVSIGDQSKSVMNGEDRSGSESSRSTLCLPKEVPESSPDSNRRSKSPGPSEAVTGSSDNLHSKKQFITLSNSVSKKTCMSIPERGGEFKDGKISQVSKVGHYQNTPLMQVTDTITNHREALNLELLNDVMHLDCEQNLSESTETDISSNVSVTSGTVLSQQVVPASAFSTAVEELTSKLCVSAGKDRKSNEHESSQTGMVVTPVSVQSYSKHVVEVLEILSSSDSSELEEGEVRDSPQKLHYQTHLKILQPLQNISLKESFLRSDTRKEGEVQDDQEDDGIVIIEESAPKKCPIAESTHLTELNSVNFSQSSCENDSRNKIVNCVSSSMELGLNVDNRIDDQATQEKNSQVESIKNQIPETGASFAEADEMILQSSVLKCYSLMEVATDDHPKQLQNTECSGNQLARAKENVPEQLQDAQNSVSRLSRAAEDHQEHLQSTEFSFDSVARTTQDCPEQLQNSDCLVDRLVKRATESSPEELHKAEYAVNQLTREQTASLCLPSLSICSSTNAHGNETDEYFAFGSPSKCSLNAAEICKPDFQVNHENCQGTSQQTTHISVSSFPEMARFATADIINKSFDNAPFSVSSCKTVFASEVDSVSSVLRQHSSQPHSAPAYRLSQDMKSVSKLLSPRKTTQSAMSPYLNSSDVAVSVLDHSYAADASEISLAQTVLPTEMPWAVDNEESSLSAIKTPVGTVISVSSRPSPPLGVDINTQTVVSSRTNNAHLGVDTHMEQLVNEAPGYPARPVVQPQVCLPLRAPWVPYDDNRITFQTNSPNMAHGISVARAVNHQFGAYHSRLHRPVSIPPWHAHIQQLPFGEETRHLVRNNSGHCSNQPRFNTDVHPGHHSNQQQFNTDVQSGGWYNSIPVLPQQLYDSVPVTSQQFSLKIPHHYAPRGSRCPLSHVGPHEILGHMNRRMSHSGNPSPFFRPMNPDV